MDNRDRKLIEKFTNDFYQLASQEGWERQDIETMKDLQKVMYYMEVRCAMKEGENYPEEEYMDEMERGERSYSGGGYSGNGGRYYDGGNMYGNYGRNSYARGGRSYRRGMNSFTRGYSGRRYYDSEKENSMNDLRQMISMEQDPEKRQMLESIMRELEK